MPKHLIQVALPVPVYRVFDYLCPSEFITEGVLPPMGGRVQVPFGRQTLVGMVVAYPDDSDIPSDKLKPILARIDDEPIFDEKLLNFARWLSAYYHYPLGETIAVMLPTLIKQGKPTTTRATTWHITKQADDDFVNVQIKKTAKKQRADFERIKDNAGSTTEMLQAVGITLRMLATLQAKGLIIAKEIEQAKPPLATLNQPHLTLNHEQQHACDAIVQALDKGVYQGILLNGITGSGKTEVYLHAIDHALQHNKQVLVLVPEIGLTPQSRERFGKRFFANIVVLHSGLNDSERLAGWQACKSGQAQIIIATRSALFYPFANLGLIIIDEAHDPSFKQQDHLRYHACDVALYLGFCQKIPVVLGSATPSLEQYKLVQDGKLAEYKLTTRAGSASVAKFHLVDLRLGTVVQTDLTGKPQDTELSAHTIKAIRQTLSRGEQVMVFLNRRGFAPILLCGACGWQADCVRCSSHLTLHKNNFKKADHPNASYLFNHLKCHHCGYQVATPSVCPSCRSSNLVHLGQGTSQLFERLHALFANPQTSTTLYPIVQIDRDTVNTKGAWDRLYAEINTSKPMILVGTQMIAKGHHFEGVTLVVVADADAGFLSPNFRSPEHTAQTILQVAGRAGRAGKAGTVLIQTYNPQNPLLNLLIHQSYDDFANTLLAERQLLGLPPFCHAVLVRADSPKLDHAKNAIMGARAYLDSHQHSFTVLAPTLAPLSKKNNHYHVHLLILAKSRQELHNVLTSWWATVPQLPSSKGVRLSIDIDPMGW